MATQAARRTRVPVLIVGGGPIGLMLAAILGRYGVGVRLIEQRPDELGSPKMIVVSLRTMEICRALGIAPAVRDWGFPLDRPLDSIFCTALTGHELGRVPTPSLRLDADTPFSPERERPCPQTWFDPILQAHARGFASVELSDDTRLVAFAQDADGVRAEIVGPDGESEIVEAGRLVGCDGFSSTVRELLGIELRGVKHLDRSMSVYIRSTAIDRVHRLGEAYRYVFVDETGPWSVLTTMDGRDYWRIQLIGSETLDVETADLDALIRRMIGTEVPYTLEGTSAWVRKMTVADRFADGRVFLAGDAAHAHPPNGGLGMNTGIQDAFDLGWKLAAVEAGWGGPTLLESYDVERRPASARAAEQSLANYRRLTAQPHEPDLLAEEPAGDEARARLGRSLVEENEKTWHPIGVHLGYVYDPSPIVVPDGTPRPPDDTVGYVPSARPGARAPHASLADGRSTLDLFGPGFALLVFAEVAHDGLVAAARRRGVPLAVHPIDDPAVARLYGAALVLVRPDGHVAWRGDAEPEDGLALIDTVRGAGPPIAARRLEPGARLPPVQAVSRPAAHGRP